MNKAISTIYGHGRGWVFTTKDISGHATPENIRVTLLRLARAGTIRRIFKGVYYYPKKSTLFQGAASPDINQVARAIARKHGWNITPSGETALNLLGLSSQVAAKYSYISNGPTRRYTWEGGDIEFRHRATKETGAMSPKTGLLIQALKALGEHNISKQTGIKLSAALTNREWKTAIRESKYATGWVHQAMRKIFQEQINE
jgi:hypothetical protein